MVYVALLDGIRGPVGVKLIVRVNPAPSLGIDPDCRVSLDVEHGLFLELAVGGWRAISKLRVA